MEGHAGHTMTDMPDHQHMPDHDMPDHDMPSSCSMNMLFNWQVKDVCVVFEWWHVHTPIDLIISCIVVFCIAAGYEYLRVWSSTLDDQLSQAEKKRLIDHQRNLVGHGEEDYETTAVDSTSFLRKEMKIARCSSTYQILRSIVYASLVGISFWLMLVFMTYNGYLMIAIVLGAGFGHLIFGNGKLKATRDIQCH